MVFRENMIIIHTLLGMWDELSSLCSNARHVKYVLYMQVWPLFICKYVCVSVCVCVWMRDRSHVFAELS